MKRRVFRVRTGRLAAWAAIVASGALASSARSEGIASKVLEELSSSLEDLAKSELANGLGRVIAERSRPLCFYFRGALDRLESNQWGNLNHALQEGLTELLGDLIVATVAGPEMGKAPPVGATASGDKTRLERFLRRGPFSELSGLRDKPASFFCEGRETMERCCSLRRWNEIGAQTLFERVCAAPAATPVSINPNLPRATLMPSSRSSQATEGRAHQPECFFARTIISAIGGEPLAREHAYGLLAYVSARPLLGRLKALGNLPQSVVELWMRSIDLRAHLRRWIEDLKGIDAATAKIDASFAVMRQMSESPDSLSKATDADRRPFVDACSRFVDQLIDVGLPGMAAVDRADSSGGAVFSRSECTSRRLSHDFIAKGIAIRGELFRMRSFLAAAHSADWTQGQHRIDLQALIVATSAICREEESVTAATPSAGGDTPEPVATPICQAVNHLRESLNELAFRRLVADVAKGDHRALARTIFPIALRKDERPAMKSETHTERLGHLYSEFLQNFASFILDGGDGKASQAIAAEAFRRSARELLMNLSGSATGFPPGGLTAWSWPRGISVGRAIANSFVPTFSFRLSWNANYFNQSGGDGFRSSPSLESLSFRASLSDSLGIQVSFLDPLAPLVEIAMRKNRSVENEEQLAFDVLRPRVDFWFGIPQLTRRFALVAGVSLRLVRAALTTRLDANQVAVEVLRYFAGESLEFNVGAMVFF